MSRLDEIVKVNIRNESASIATASFDRILILVNDVSTLEIKEYTKSDLSDLRALTAQGGQSADAIFGQDPAPTRVVVATLGQPASWTDQTIAEKLQAIIDSTLQFYYVVCAFGVSDDSTDNTTGTYDEFLAGLKSFVLANEKMCILHPKDNAKILTTKLAQGDTALDSLIGLTSRFAIIAGTQSPLGTGNDEQVSSAWVGKCATYEPGSLTWAYKNLGAFATPRVFSTTQFTNLKNRLVNWYEKIAGQSITRRGTTLDSSYYIDNRVGIDWIKARLQERVYALLVANSKIPYNDAGILLIKSEVLGVLNTAQNMGILQSEGMEVSVPAFADIPVQDRMDAVLKNVNWRALIQGAIQTVEINGVVTW
ncbi:DUF3383 family protein [Treponema sp. R6D11]